MTAPLRKAAFVDRDGTLNEMVYDPNGSNNSSLMSLVSGTICRPEVL